VSGHCPGAADIQCCVSTCSTSTGNGSCLWTGSSCANSFIANKCPGPNDVQCCPPSAGVKTTAVSPTISNPSSPQPTGNPQPTETTSNPAPSQDSRNSSPSQDASNPSPSPDTGIPSHSETASPSSPSENAPSTPLGDANSSAFPQNYPSSTPSTTATSKTSTATPKIPGTNKSGSSSVAAAGSPKHISGGAIAGIVIAGLIGLAAMVAFTTQYILKKKRQAQGQQLRENPETEQYTGSELDGSGSASFQV
jgi:hypothetical protein